MVRRNGNAGKEKVSAGAGGRLAGRVGARHNHRCSEPRTVSQPCTVSPDSETETGRNVDDIFLPSGRLRPDLFDEATTRVLREALAHTRATNWDSVRTPHLFMGLLAAPDSGVFNWATKLGADLPGLLEQFRELFHQQNADSVPPLLLNREFLSDNVIRLLRDAQGRATASGRNHVTPMDLLITLFPTPNSMVAECFERIGVTAAKLTELAVLAERDAPAK